MAPVALSSACAGIPDVPIPDNPTMNDRFFLGVGAFQAETSTEARLDSAAFGLGATLDFEESLGLEDKSFVPFGMSRIRLTDRWRLELEYFQLQRESQSSLDVDIRWGDEVFPISTGLDVRFDVAVARLSLGYAFFRRKDKELGIALGVHQAKIEASLEDSSGNGDLGELFAPLPVASLYGGIALTDTCSLALRVDAFSLEYGAYSGRVLSQGIELVYQPLRHVGLGLGFRSLFVDLEASDGDFRGKIESDFRGPIAFLNVSF